MTRLKKTEARLERSAHRATQWIGSTRSLLVHSFVFLTCFALPFFGVTFDRVLLALTTAVSLEAIYLAIFIQMSVNKNTEDIEDIQEDVEEIQEDIGEIQEDVDEIQEDIEEEQNEEQRIEHKEAEALSSIQKILTELQREIEQLKKK